MVLNIFENNNANILYEKLFYISIPFLFNKWFYSKNQKSYIKQKTNRTERAKYYFRVPYL